jgi:hypothetical protein
MLDRVAGHFVLYRDMGKTVCPMCSVQCDASAFVADVCRVWHWGYISNWRQRVQRSFRCLQKLKAMLDVKAGMSLICCRENLIACEVHVR